MSRLNIYFFGCRPELSSFSKEYTEYAGGGGGQWQPYAFKNIDSDALLFRIGSIKINIFKVLFWEGGGHKKNTLCMLLLMFIIMDDPLLGYV